MGVLNEKRCKTELRDKCNDIDKIVFSNNPYKI